MSFGRRNRDEWIATQDDLVVVEELLEVEESVGVRIALEEIRQNKLLNETLAPVQKDLWDRLLNAYKLGGADLIRINFQLSGMEVEDLFDLLHVANELAVFDEGGEYEGFGDALFAFLQTQSSHQMDALLAEYFESIPSIAEPQLIRLVSNEVLIKSRLDDLLQMEMDCLTQAIISEGVLTLLAMEAEDSDDAYPMIYIDEQEALEYLRILMLDETILYNGFVKLIEKINDGPIMLTLMDQIIQLLKNPINSGNYVGGFDSIGAAVVEQLNLPGLISVVNSQSESLLDERLLALSKMKSLCQISDAALVQLLLDKDDVRYKADSRSEKRDSLRQTILANKDFRKRLMKFGIIGMFQQNFSQA